MKCSHCNSDLPLGGSLCNVCGRGRPADHFDFSDVEMQYSHLRERWRKGELDDATFDAALQKLIYTDSAGDYWMVGRESGKWHRYDGEEWVREDPPAQPVNAVEKQQPVEQPEPVPAQPVEPPSTRTERKPASALKGLLIVAGILLATCILIAFIAAIFGQQLTNTTVNFALDQGWGEIVTPETPASTMSIVTTALPAQTLPKPTTPTPTQTPDYLLLPGWNYTDCPSEGVQIAIPPGFTYTLTERNNAFIQGSESFVGLIVMSEEASHGDTLANEWDWWINDANADLTCDEPLYNTSSLGEVIWTTCRSAENTLDFTAVAGPTVGGKLITFYGLTPDDETSWNDYIAIYLEMAKSVKQIR